VGEVESAEPVVPSRDLESVKPAGAVSNSPDLPGIGLSFEVIKSLVAAIRFTAPASPFLRPRGFSGLAIRRRSTGHSHGPGLPFKAHVTFSAGVLRGSGTPLMGFLSPSANKAGRSTDPGFQTRFVPPSGFLTLLAVYSLHCFPTSRVGAAHGVLALQSLTPPQSRTPRGASTLMLFLTSRAPALRTRRSRCPATPGPCSLRRSVLRQTGVHHSRCSHGLFAVRNSPAGLKGRRLPTFVLRVTGNRTRRARAPLDTPEFPDPRTTGLRRVSWRPPCPEGSGGGLPAPRSQLPGTRFRRTWPHSVRASTRTCPRVLPTTVMS